MDASRRRRQAPRCPADPRWITAPLYPRSHREQPPLALPMAPCDAPRWRRAQRVDVYLRLRAIWIHLARAIPLVLGPFFGGRCGGTVVGTGVPEADPPQRLRRRTLRLDRVRTSPHPVSGGWLDDWVVDNIRPCHCGRTGIFDWATIIPVISFWCLLLDGVFIGAASTREMRTAMLVSVVVYLATWWLLRPWGNAGLWAALFCPLYRTRRVAHPLPATTRAMRRRLTDVIT